MEQTNSKKKTLTVAAAAVAVLALVGVIAYLADASGTIRNIFSSDHSTHLEVEITETDVPHDNGDKEYNVTPGATADKDPKVSVDTNGDAYVYAIVKDTVNSHGKTLVDYQIADGWVELDKSTLTDKDIQKYNEIFTDKDMTEGKDKVHIDVDDQNTHIYYRIVNGTDDASRFEYPVLKGNSISYPSTLTNEDLALLKSITEAGDRALDFQTYAVQMTPFCPADKVEDADPTSDEQKGYAAEAWNQKAPAPEATAPAHIETTAHTLTVHPTVPGNQYIVVPKGTDPITEDMWTSTGQTSNGGEALTFTGLDADTEYDVISRTPATSDQGTTSDNSEPTTAVTMPLATGITVTEKSGKTSFAVDENAQMVATVEPEDADKEVTWSSSDPSVATVDPDTGKVTCVGVGDATITATAKDGTSVKGEYPISVKAGLFLYQVKLHGVSNGTATFWPAFNTKADNYGKHEHEGDCIVDHTWAEIASGSYDFSNCIAAGCTKDVPVDTQLNRSVFNIVAHDHRDTAFATKGNASSDPQYNPNGIVKIGHPFGNNTVQNAVAACNKVKEDGVNVSFREMTYNECVSLAPQSGAQPKRTIYMADGNGVRFWTATKAKTGKGWSVASNGHMGHTPMGEYDAYVPIMTVSTN